MDAPGGTRALTAACTAFVLVPNLGAVLGGGERTDRYDTTVTPPAYAFAVWGPIFAACAVDVVSRWRTPTDHPDGDAATAGPLAAAYALNSAWSVAAQTDRFALTQGLLPAAAACAALAHRRVQEQAAPRPSTVTAAGLLTGWTVLASAVNVTADTVRRGAAPQGRTAAAVGLASVTVAGTASAVAVGGSRHGRTPLAAPVVWGLLTLAADRTRPRAVRTLAATLAAGVGGALAVRPDRR